MGIADTSSFASLNAITGYRIDRYELNFHSSNDVRLRDRDDFV
jgi:hypothetical protein